MEKTLTKSSFDHALGLGIARVLAGCALLTLCSEIRIPLQPVPITLHTVAVLFIGLLFSRKEAAFSVLAYLAIRFLGVPASVHSSIGFACFAGPTAGYLLGFLPAVVLMATVRDRFLPKAHWLHRAVLGTLGTLCVLAFGVSWLSHFIGWERAFEAGVMPFILPGLVKMGVLVCALQMYRSVTNAHSD